MVLPNPPIRESILTGYPWTVIRMSRRDAYMKALEAASVKGQITPLAEFIAQEMREWSPERKDKA